jgi:hypothetical protein
MVGYTLPEVVGKLRFPQLLTAEAGSTTRRTTPRCCT